MRLSCVGSRLARLLARSPVPKSSTVRERLEKKHMKCSSILYPAVVLAVVDGVLATSIAHADILGFGDFSGFTVNQNDSGSAPTASGGTIQLTTLSREYRSIFYDTPRISQISPRHLSIRPRLPTRSETEGMALASFFRTARRVQVPSRTARLLTATSQARASE